MPSLFLSLALSRFFFVNCGKMGEKMEQDRSKGTITSIECSLGCSELVAVTQSLTVKHMQSLNPSLAFLAFVPALAVAALSCMGFYFIVPYCLFSSKNPHIFCYVFSNLGSCLESRTRLLRKKERKKRVYGFHSHRFRCNCSYVMSGLRVFCFVF